MSNASDEELGRGQRSTPITPSDTEAQPSMRALHVGVGGSVWGLLRGDADDAALREFVGVSGIPLNYDFKIIHTDTDADKLVAIH